MTVPVDDPLTERVVHPTSQVGQGPTGDLVEVTLPAGVRSAVSELILQRRSREPPGASTVGDDAAIGSPRTVRVTRSPARRASIHACARECGQGARTAQTCLVPAVTYQPWSVASSAIR